MFQTRCWVTAAASLLSIGRSGVSAPATLNVPGDFATIQACIDAAVSGVDECVVAPGTYHETINFLGKAIALRSSGGADVTTIDATGIGGSVVTCATGEGPDTVLDGFTITGGTGIESPFFARLGGGMYNGHTSPTVNNCTFSRNTAIGSEGGYGGGMFNNSASPTVTNCAFIKNASQRGGGMSNYDGSGATVTNCIFSGNTGYEGGGMSNTVSSPTVTKCTFTGNTATYHGAGMDNYGGSPTVTNCAFSGNTADYGAGGGMYNHGGSPTVTNCTFSGNTARYDGGGMYNEHNSSPTVTGCTFSVNTGRFFGGGMANYFVSNPTVTNCTFSGNKALAGGGMSNDSNSSPMVTNCTFSANAARYDGGGMYNDYYSSPTVTNCILWGNLPDEIFGRSTTVSFSDVQGGLPVGAVDGGGNVDLDPVFVRPPDPGPDGTWDGVDDDYGDVRLQAGSPCVNAGDPGFVAQPAETDLEGHARVLCGRVDMGAYEFGIGDYDCDQVVDLTDFSSWPACMTAPVVQSAIDNRQLAIGCTPFDFDGDGDVDLLDFGGFQRIVGP